MFQWYAYIAALFVPSIGTTDIMIKVEALTNFTKRALLDRTKAIQALNEEQIQMVIFPYLKELNWNSITSTCFVRSDAS